MITEAALHEIVYRLSHRMELAPPELYVFTNDYNDKYFVAAKRQRLPPRDWIEIEMQSLEVWSFHEWEAVLAHELAHLKLDHCTVNFENEFAADAMAATYTSADAMRSALEKFKAEEIAAQARQLWYGLALTHPPIEERIERLRTYTYFPQPQWTTSPVTLSN